MQPAGYGRCSARGVVTAAALYGSTLLAACSGGGSGSDSAFRGSTADGPRVRLSADAETVEQGESVVLSWNARQVDACRASGGWSGPRPPQGRVTVGPLTRATTYTLTCRGDGERAVAMLAVSVLGPVRLRWEAPEENVDGSPLDDLAGFRIHYGAGSREYSGQLDVRDPSATTHVFELPSGSYYIGMTA
ncbi:MAG: hypothetical protein ACODAC_05390, partial [Pseudomonadota bacterium]